MNTLHGALNELHYRMHCLLLELNTQNKALKLLHKWLWENLFSLKDGRDISPPPHPHTPTHVVVSTACRPPLLYPSRGVT